MATGINPTSAASTYYYPLPNRQSRSGSITRANNAVVAAYAFEIDALVNTGNSANSSLLDISDRLDLSPEAQHFLDFFNASNALNGALTLTDEQRTQIDNVILRFRDAPMTPETFHDIETALEDEGLSPEQIAAQEQTSPLSLAERLANLMSGSQEENTSVIPDQQDRDNRDAYLRTVFSEWERISNQFHPPVIANFIQPPTPLRRSYA